MEFPINLSYQEISYISLLYTTWSFYYEVSLNEREHENIYEKNDNEAKLLFQTGSYLVVLNIVLEITKIALLFLF